MISEKEVVAAICECQQEPITGSKRSALADLLVIHHYLFDQRQEETRYSESRERTRDLHSVQAPDDSVFLSTINGKPFAEVLLVLDELMDAVKILHPRIYDSVLKKIEEI